MADPTLEEGLRCPICFYFPEEEVFICKNGHSICKKCSSHVQQCPECRVSYRQGLVRNRALENLLQTVEVECPKRDGADGLGCDEKVKLKDVESHLKNCSMTKSISRSEPAPEPINNNYIQLCKLLGFSKCDFFIDLLGVMAGNVTNYLPSIRDHFVQKHLGVPRSSPGLKIKLAQFGLRSNAEAETGNEITMWHPVVLNLDGTTNGRTFLILAMLHPDDSKNLSWFSIFLGGGDQHEGILSQSQYNILFRVSGYQWTFPAIGLSNSTFSAPAEALASVLKVRPFRTPMDLLKSFMKPNEDFLVVELEIITAKPMLSKRKNFAQIQELLPFLMRNSSSTTVASQSQTLLTAAPEPGPSHFSIDVGFWPTLIPQLSSAPFEEAPPPCPSCGRKLNWKSSLSIDAGSIPYSSLQSVGNRLICKTCSNIRINKQLLFVMVDSCAKARVVQNVVIRTPRPHPSAIPDFCKERPRCQHNCHGTNMDHVPIATFVCIECPLLIGVPSLLCNNCVLLGRAQQVHSPDHILAEMDTEGRSEFLGYLFHKRVLPKFIPRP